MFYSLTGRVGLVAEKAGERRQKKKTRPLTVELVKRKRERVGLVRARGLDKRIRRTQGMKLLV